MNKFTLVRGTARLKTVCALGLLLALGACATAPNSTAQAIASANASGTICSEPGFGLASNGSLLQTTDCSDDAISNISDVVSSGYSHF